MATFPAWRRPLWSTTIKRFGVADFPLTPSQACYHDNHKGRRYAISLFGEPVSFYERVCKTVTGMSDNLIKVSFVCIFLVT